MGTETTVGKLAAKYCSRFSKTSNTAVADKLLHDHPLHFKDKEAARTAVRRARGKTGEKDRNSKADKSNFGFVLPKPVSVDHEPLKLRKADNNIGVISDLHIPNHREEPILVALNYFKKHKVNTIIINGDLLDNTPFSKWDHKPPGADDVRNWFDDAESFLAMLRKRFPKARILWLEGNHDAWYTRWLMKKAPIIFNDEYYHLQQRLHLKDYNIEYIPQERFVLAGKLAICHGHHIIKGVFAPVNAARGAYLRSKRSLLIGHVHVESSHTETDLLKDIVTTWSTGCLCTLTPDYQPMAGKACHGFAHVQTDAKGAFHVKNYRIHNGVIL
ncbi:MAG: hypothetical protein EOO14_00325 [Chitinophagaceae bacterium]|nr:MAG: hypothetical protein EOO14_00325 [Chitinophagaceae bacterium]